jgi:cysteine desulfurase/selenocysteine lyase
MLGSRHPFSASQILHYYAFAGVSLLSDPVVAAMRAAIDLQASRGVGAMGAYLEGLARTKAEFGRLIGVDGRDVAWMGNTSNGVTAVATCRPWRRGDRILCFEGEFPANVTPWQVAAREHGLEVLFHSTTAFEADPDAALARVEDELRRGVALVAVSAVQFQSGLRMPIPELRRLTHAHGAELFVDAIQGAGVVPLDLGDVDYVACGGHKWLGGPVGTGFVAARPDRWAALEPRLAGWLSHVDGVKFLFEGPGHLRYDRPFRQGPAMFEAGGFNAVGAAGLGAAIEILAEIGVERIAAHVASILEPLEAGLVTRGFTSRRSTRPDQRSGILAVRPPEGFTAEVLSARLAKRGVATSTPDGWLRFAPHWPNGVDEVEPVLAAVDASLREG